jgi:hypothetical protein
MQLRWEKQGGGESEFGYSGDILVGMVVKRIDGGVGWNATCAVRLKWTAKTNGTVKSFATGRRAVERGWNRWLERANLQPHTRSP